MSIAARLIMLGVAGTGCCAVQAQEFITPPPAARGPSLALALEAAQAAVDTCKSLHSNIGVTVVDSAGVVKVLLASDDAFEKAVTTSTEKALTAKDFNMPTSELFEKVKTDAALAEKVKANPKYRAEIGGVLLKVGNEVIGAIGVGGSIGRGRDKNYPDPNAPNRDGLCADAALAKISARLK